MSQRPPRTAAQLAANRRGEGEKWCQFCHCPHPMAQFNKSTGRPDGHASRCRKVKATPDAHRRSHLKARYDLSPEQYDALLIAQGGVCAICGGGNGEDLLYVDHHHATNALRNLLCRPCNLGIGCFQDSPGLMHRAGIYLTAGAAGVAYAVALGRGLEIRRA